MCLWVDIHVGLMFRVFFLLWMNELGGVNLGKKLSINPKWLAWEVRGYSLSPVDDSLVGI